MQYSNGLNLRRGEPMTGLSTENSVRVGLVLTHQYRAGSDLFAAVAEQRETLRFIGPECPSPLPSNRLTSSPA
jgi:hypothetical protein